MAATEASLVDILREFLLFHQTVRDIVSRHRSGELRFAEVHDLVRDDDQSVLYRLKERCHSLFRDGDASARVGMHREALFDLAVGSLFHEAMKFRENLYQREIYAPKVHELRGTAGGEEAHELFAEFERILEQAGIRLEETLEETEILLERTREHLVLLLASRPHDVLVARYLLLKRELAEAVFGLSLDELLAQIYGDATSGHLAAAHSFLESSYFKEALATLAGARQRAPASDDLDRLAHYAEGMQAFVAGRYDESLDRLEEWVAEGPGGDERAYADLAFAAVSRVDHLTTGRAAKKLARRASKLAKRIEPLTSSAG